MTIFIYSVDTMIALLYTYSNVILCNSNRFSKWWSNYLLADSTDHKSQDHQMKTSDIIRLNKWLNF